MAKIEHRKILIPDESTPRFFGRLTLLFSGVLLALGLWGAASYMITPLMKPMAHWMEAWVERENEESVLRRLDTLTIDLAEAKTPTEVADANLKISRILNQPRPTFAAMTVGMGGMDSPVVRIFSLVDLIVGIALNVALAIAAAGLVGLREWGRKGVIIASALKLAKLVLSSVVMLGWIVPIQMRAMQAQLDPILKAQPAGAPGVPFSATMLAAISTGGTIGWALLASIYPILLLVMLSKPRVRAACRAASLPVSGSNG